MKSESVELKDRRERMSTIPNEASFSLAKKAFCEVVDKAWVVYDRAVDSARKVRDVALAEGKDSDEVWKVFNEETLPARIVFEETITPNRKRKDIVMEDANRHQRHLKIRHFKVQK